MAVIKLKSSDGDVFTVEAAVVRCSSKIKEMIVKRGKKEDAAKEPIEIELAVKGAILKKAIEWMEYYKNDAPANSLDENAKSDWETNFLKNFENQTSELFDLVRAANYLGLNGLVVLTCQAVGDL